MCTTQRSLDDADFTQQRGLAGDEPSLLTSRRKLSAPLGNPIVFKV